MKVSNRAGKALILALFSVSLAACDRGSPFGGGNEVSASSIEAQAKDPQMRAFYDETVATFAKGSAFDVDAYEARSFAIFREFARAHGADEAAMVDHLKLIPRQVVDIVKEDPSVLRDYDSFWAAVAGPD